MILLRYNQSYLKFAYGLQLHNVTAILLSSPNVSQIFFGFLLQLRFVNRHDANRFAD